MSKRKVLKYIRKGNTEIPEDGFVFCRRNTPLSQTGASRTKAKGEGLLRNTPVDHARALEVPRAILPSPVM